MAYAIGRPRLLPAALRHRTLLPVAALHCCLPPAPVLCRYQARELWLGLKEPLEQMGVAMACIVHEWIPAEVRAAQCAPTCVPAGSGSCRADRRDLIAALLHHSPRACVAHGSQIKSFAKYWPGTVYHDKDKEFYKVCVPFVKCVYVL